MYYLFCTCPAPVPHFFLPTKQGPELCIPHFFQQRKHKARTRLFRDYFNKGSTKQPLLRFPHFQQRKHTKKPQRNHKETTKKPQRNHKETTKKPQRNHKETTKKPQRNHKETTLYPSAIDVHAQVLDLRAQLHKVNLDEVRKFLRDCMKYAHSFQVALGNLMRLRAVTRVAGGMATHWNGAYPLPHANERRENPIASAEFDTLLPPPFHVGDCVYVRTCRIRTDHRGWKPAER